MRKFLLAAVGFAALVGACGMAQAQNHHGPPPGGGRFFQADANNDGVVTRQEFDAFRAAEFTRLDANHDGQLTRDEMRAGHQWRHHGDQAAVGGPSGLSGDHHRGRHFDMLARADANHDGNISREEFLARPNQMFDHLDTNHDGVISADERQAILQQMQSGMAHARTDHPNPDANGDGVISHAEFDTAGAAKFARLDANHDGRVTREEAESARPHFHGG